MLKIITFMLLLSAVRGTKYAYIGNHIVEFPDAPKQTFSFTYPKDYYREPKIIRIDQATQNMDQSTQNIARATQNIEQSTQNIAQSSQYTEQSAQNITQSTQNIEQSTQNIVQSSQYIEQLAQNISEATQNIEQSTQNIVQSTQNIQLSTENYENVTVVQTSDTPPTTVITETKPVEPSPSPPGIMSSLVSKVISFAKRIIMKVITAIVSCVFNFLSIPARLLTSVSNNYNIDPLANVSKLSSSVTPERLKRAVDYLETEIKKMKYH